jgi:hypothetical protein
MARILKSTERAQDRDPDGRRPARRRRGPYLSMSPMAAVGGHHVQLKGKQTGISPDKLIERADDGTWPKAFDVEPCIRAGSFISACSARSSSSACGFSSRGIGATKRKLPRRMELNTSGRVGIAVGKLLVLAPDVQALLPGNDHRRPSTGPFWFVLRKQCTLNKFSAWDEPPEHGASVSFRASGPK